jgi:hypothetical protein
MSAGYDEYKEEALRLLLNEDMLVQSVRHHIGSLRTKFLPALKIEGINENHYRTWEKFVITIAGSCSVLEDHISTGPHHEEVKRARRQRRWAVRKLRDFGDILGSATTRVSSNHGTVYFSYHLIVPMDSHIT